MHLFTILAMLAASHQTVLAASDADWRSRSIYQILTDRFALTNGSTTTPCDTGPGLYCGGTWQGIIDHLDYVQGMGFDAIWISPITKQLEGDTIDGSAYHGYWQTDINAVNENFGVASDIEALAAEVHARGMYLMIDLVVNHFAWSGAPDTVDYSTFDPFNSQSYYHPYCSIDYNNLTNATNVEQCWMGDTNVPLPDLRTEDSDVSDVWDTWVAEMISNYSVDGLRLDSAMEVDTGFWASFQDSAGVYSLGEIDAPDNDFVCSFQHYLPGVFNYAMYTTLIAAFNSTNGSIYNLADMINAIKICPDTSLLGTFSENHDQPRFASMTGDFSLAQNVISFTMLTDGIPVIYQGQEQHYAGVGGGGVPYNREALWLSGYDTEAELYELVAKLNTIRKNAIADSSVPYTTTQNIVLYNDYTNIAMRKGELVTVLSNVGATGTNYTLTIPSKYTSGTKVTEMLTCNTLTVSTNGTLSVPMNQGLPRIYYPSDSISGSGLCNSTSTKKMKRSRHFRLS